MSNGKSAFVGTWRIMWMELWERDYLDMEVPAFITIHRDGKG